MCKHVCLICKYKRICYWYNYKNQYSDYVNNYVEEPNSVKCKECEYLMFSDCYGECSKGFKGIVSPNDSCGKGKIKGSK